MSAPDVAALQAGVSDALAQLARADAAMVKLQGMVKTLGGRVLALESTQPKPKPEISDCTDPNRPSEADREAMRKRLKARTLEGIAANKLDRDRAGRTYTHKDTEKIGM